MTQHTHILSLKATQGNESHGIHILMRDIDDDEFVIHKLLALHPEWDSWHVMDDKDSDVEVME